MALPLPVGRMTALRYQSIQKCSVSVREAQKMACSNSDRSPSPVSLRWPGSLPYKVTPPDRL